jgi:phage gp16-like protein
MSGRPHVEDVRRRELAQIHIAKQQLGMDDDTYRSVLWTVARVKSSADLDWAGRKRVLDYLKKCGFKPLPPKRAGERELDDSAQAKMVRGMWLELHEAGVVKDPSERALNRWVKRMTGVDALRWLAPAQMNVVIEALKKWNDRPRP